jgi:hypothetical protein
MQIIFYIYNKDTNRKSLRNMKKQHSKRIPLALLVFSHTPDNIIDEPASDQTNSKNAKPLESVQRLGF